MCLQIFIFAMPFHSRGAQSLSPEGLALPAVNSRLRELVEQHCDAERCLYAESARLLFPRFVLFPTQDGELLRYLPLPT